MSVPPPIEPDRLLAQTAWVKRLALSLARDEASADDLVQETLFQALRRPPRDARDEGGLRAWLAAVTRHAASRRAREGERRERREKASAREEFADSEDHAVELERLRAELFRHVMALAEPSRQVVLLRYFEELDSAEIARRLAVPDSTVRNRLRRALQELRERMQRAHGADWRNLCLFVAPLHGAKALVGGGASLALVIGSKWMLGGAALVLLALCWISWERVEGPPRRSLDVLSATALASDIARASDTAASSRSNASESLEAPSLPPQARVASEPTLHLRVREREDEQPFTRFEHGLIVYGIVRDPSGAPISGVVLSWTDSEGHWVVGGTRAGAFAEEGKYSANSLRPGLQVVRVFGPGWRSEVFERTLLADQELQQFDFTLRPSTMVPVYLVTTDGKSVQGRETDPWWPFLSTRNLIVTRERPPDLLDLSPDSEEWRAASGNRPTSWDPPQPAPEGALGWLELDLDPPFHVSLLVSDKILLVTQHFESVPERVDLTLAPAALSRIPTRGGGIPPGLASIQKSMFPPGEQFDVVRGRPARLPEDAPRMNLRFIDLDGRPVRACFHVDRECPEGQLRASACDDGISLRAKGNGEFSLGRTFTGPCVLHVTGAQENADPTFVPIGARPVRLDIPDEARAKEHVEERVVQLVPLRTIVFSDGSTSSASRRWVISTCDGLFVRRGVLLGHEARRFGLPPGDYHVDILDALADDVLAACDFQVAERALALELVR